ncbi:sigma 54-interacting transcriptional regulator [Thiohalobacter sp. IOR34]|uniref:sigma-54 interaction domain-containing protein n=1 Tax=Thiohalobacter sp. IOR34 TaxID=3057176 RepID=UPI0025AFF50E|nr:sigma 54-interacting transcriptional regulator [Thiohalobacter sp. IOR34]WJW76767.1 sigma 54-interacting transcriptional regulator [Thiohalobacter sp. IOR34]
MSKIADPLKPTCEQIIDIIPDPFVVIDRDYQIVAANRAYRARYGVEIGELVGRRCHEVSHHSSVPCSENGEHCPLEDVLERKHSTQVMHVHYDNNGKEEYVQLHASPLLDESGEVRYIGESIFKVVTHDVDNDALLVGRSQPLFRMASLLQRVAPTQTTVLLTGESGSGKEQVAKYVHHYSTRANRDFVVVDCGALGESLIESELFGYERGAFTGATQRKKGLFEAADGGTLFIDEVGELPLSLQTKLLRALETSQIRRVGGTEYIPVDVRIIAATNRNLQAMVAEGQFRQDLYYRLSAFPVQVPPLRERKDDIPRLAEYFLSQMEDADRHIPLSAEVIETLLDYDYPGNVRELRNIIERAAILACDDIIRPEHIVLERPEERKPDLSVFETPIRLLSRRSGRLSGEAVLHALNQAQGHRARAAELLGVSERTLYRYIRRMKQAEAG